MFYFEYSLHLEVITVAQGRWSWSKDHDTTATGKAAYQERHLFAAAA